MLEYRLAQLTTVFAFLAIFVGATVHPTGSGMACPDWTPLVPICNGQVFPEMTGGVLFEHGHRFAAYSVGILTVLLGVALWRRRRHDRTVRALGLSAAAVVLLQGTLGGLTVLLGKEKTVAAISFAHLALAMAYFSLLVVLTHRLAPRPTRVLVAGSLRRWVGVALVALYLQILLGALVRHAGAALQCPDLPLCAGRFWPESALAQVHMLHRYGAVVAGLLVLGSAGAVLWRARGRLRLVAAAAIGVLAGQVILGVYSVVTLTAVPVVVAHLAVGALLLGLQLSLYLGLGRTPVADAAVWAETAPVRT